MENPTTIDAVELINDGSAFQPITRWDCIIAYTLHNDTYLRVHGIGDTADAAIRDAVIDYANALLKHLAEQGHSRR